MLACDCGIKLFIIIIIIIIIINFLNFLGWKSISWKTTVWHSKIKAGMGFVPSRDLFYLGFFGAAAVFR